MNSTSACDAAADAEIQREFRPGARRPFQTQISTPAEDSRIYCAAHWGRVLAGGAAGSVLNGGVGELVKELQESGHDDVASS